MSTVLLFIFAAASMVVGVTSLLVVWFDREQGPMLVPGVLCPVLSVLLFVLWYHSEIPYAP